MINAGFPLLMARYNAWQNRSLVAAASLLDDAARNAPRGAFFGSIAGTLNHLYWGDAIWLHRFAGTPKPVGGIVESAGYFTDWSDFILARAALDDAILSWASGVDPAWLEGKTHWHSRAANRDMVHDNARLVVHFFNHQTHHRGQVHAMLTAAGVKPDDTDLILLPD